MSRPPWTTVVGPATTQRRRRGVRDGGLLALATLVLAWASAWLVPLPGRLSVGPSPVVHYRDGRVAHAFLAPDDRWRIQAPLSELDPALVRGLQLLEDRRFGWHLGVDSIAIVRALGSNLSAGRVRSGGSTLTMQLVRLAEPRPRTLRSKVVEAARAIQLELRWPKRRILEAWLTFAPFGRNLEGVEVGSLAIFKHRAQALSPMEVATLLAIPQDPADRRPSRANQGRLRAGRDRVARRLHRAGLWPGVDQDTLLGWLTTTDAPDALHPLPKEAPHAARWLLHAAQGEGPGPVGTVPSTLDAGAQRVVTGLVHRRTSGLHQQGIDNAAVVVIDTKSSELRALLGNPDFWDAERDGQIPSFLVPRSPGSALKPLLYAQAIDHGIALPEFVVEDVPREWGGYAPRNYDGSWSGVVRLEDALSRSLNLPFVSLLQEVGTAPFLSWLERLGARSLSADGRRHGLSAIVGGVEITPLELAAIYTSFAREGRYRPLRSRLDRPLEHDITTMSPGAAWLTRRALRLRDRPDFPTRATLTGLPRGTHWKTGTSAGRKDAWALGSDTTHTVAVWLGNLDQRGAAELSGADSAAPLLFDVLEALAPRGLPPPPDDPPGDLRLVPVCAWSGHPVGLDCPERREALAVAEHVPTRTCPYHQRLEVERRSGLLVTPACAGARDTTQRTFLVLPGAVRRHLQGRGVVLPDVPRHAPGCEPPLRPEAPRIVSPGQGSVVLVLPGLPPEDQQVPFLADARAAEELRWFVDGELLGRVAPGERLWWTPSIGTHELVVTDERGLAARRELQVRVR